jgi:hypothetical protein
MGLLFKLAASTVSVLCTTTSVYLLVDGKTRHGVIFAATVKEPTTDNNNDLIKPDQGLLSSPIRSSEQWNWNWDGLVKILFSRMILFFFVVVVILK